ncbi:MAG: peptide deformylase [Candidatus Ryanbacteria bacterium RIFCSPHIGHO2_02_FULL_45_17b]|uniref:Peptide deformylase n=1 Tax=Candidatus Ryanbacteria bacterium RIFCSPHIGHO2_01_FULL_45_22 TaxID=1802114 RepID=A0A1G2G0R8_9BACT|nr:MAG: peptide deformylase [Candidatus Ryanbacteria bacterium RIFCSPHIGHO2_01_FULL_45_22]OGZ47048.1 MAG: peptide deformylase [Candidatus Ryanbacteria bacterium RIFCSPHIGHO2_02_FULL_45_17b]
MSPQNSKKIVTNPNPVLHKRALEVPIVEITSKKIQHILADMTTALRGTSEGIGIAAPQIGHSLQIFLASEEALRWDELEDMPREDRKKKQWTYYTFINPIIRKASKKKTSETEGCLSVPKTYGTVERSEKITVEAYDETGKKFQRGTSKLYARVMQHEIDHLNGILFIEKAKNIKNIHAIKPEI